MLFGNADRFHQLLEAAAVEAHESVRLIIQFLKEPTSAKSLADLTLTRRKEKRIAEQIRAELVKTFMTGFDREDIEALALALYKIPKTVEKMAERIALGYEQVRGVNFTRQIEIMEEATDMLLVMIKQLRNMKHVEKMHEMNAKLQYLEGEADKLMLGLLNNTRLSIS
jgi:hypothetical protein